MIEDGPDSIGISDINRESLYLSSFFHELNSNEINYCVLRNYETLPDSIPGSDVDLLVSKKGRSLLIEKIKETAERQGWEIDSRYKKSYRIDHIRLCHTGSNTTDIIRFDVMDDIGLGFFRVLEGNPILSERKRRGANYIVDEESEALINILNALYARKRLKKKYLEQARAILNTENNIEKSLNSLIGKTNTEGVIESVTNNEIVFRPDKFTWILVKNNRWRVAGMAADVLYNLASRVFRYINPPGRMIVILGPDGVGKSTVAEKVANSLSAAFSGTHVFHLRPMMIPSLSRFKRDRSNQNTVNTVSVDDRKPTLLLSLIRVLYYGFDYVFGYWIKIRPLLAKGSLIVFDRYFFDYYVDKKQKAVDLPENVLCRIFSVFPGPERVFVLQASPQDIHKRRADLSLAEIEHQNYGYMNLMRRYKTVSAIDASVSVTSIVNQIKRIIFSH